MGRGDSAGGQPERGAPGHRFTNGGLMCKGLNGLPGRPMPGRSYSSGLRDEQTVPPILTVCDILFLSNNEYS